MQLKAGIFLDRQVAVMDEVMLGQVQFLKLLLVIGGFV